MDRRSPTLEGFKVMFTAPSLGLAEIAWRWSLGFATTVLAIFCVLEYLDTLPVTRADLLMMRTGQPPLILRAIAHIFEGSAARFVFSLLVLGLAFAVAWIVLASIGRAATVRALVDRFRQTGAIGEGLQLRGMLGLNFLRVAVTLAAAIGLIAALRLAGTVSSREDPSPGSAILVFLTVVMVVGACWMVVNWFLSLASVFTAEPGRDTIGALVAAADLCRTRTGSVMAAGTWFGLAHIVAFFVASSVVAFPLALAAVLPGGVVLGGVLLVTLLYFGAVDFLYAGRLAAYVAIAELPTAMPTSPNAAPLTISHAPLSAAVDRDEPILSDLPLPPSSDLV